MPQESRKNQFLAKAKEAEEHAAKAKDPETRDTWLKIAQNYGELAASTSDSRLT